MRKIPSELENPFDNLCIDLGDFLSPLFRKLGLTPNNLTSVSLIMGLVSVHHYKKSNYVLSLTYFLLSYLFDCFDGFYARKYGMYSKFGDYYDHIKDIFVFGLLFYEIYKKYSKLEGWRRYLPFGLLVFLPSILIQLGCQEILHDKGFESGNDSLFLTRSFCPIGEKSVGDKPKGDKQKVFDIMKISRFGGTGSAIIYICGLIYYSQYADEQLIN